ncbi:molybdopterin-binding protein [Oscillospiraceae bacterium PP1C4]
MKKIETVKAVGYVLCHDLTQIIKGETKDARFRKGHIVTEEDIPVLLSMGKDYLYIWEKQEGMLHENDAARILCDLCKNDYMSESPVKEGKIDLFAEVDGLLKINVEKLDAINSLDEIMIATRSNHLPVKKGDKLAGTRVIPLVIAEEKLKEAQEIAGDQPLLKILPYKAKKCGIVTTGNEVFFGRIKDTFSPVVADKLKEFSAQIMGVTLCGDKPEDITAAIQTFLANGADLVVCTGGMSVDPDDRTPAAIRDTGAQIVSYGAPVLPGAMFLLSYLDGKPIMGLPGCVMYAKRTIFDLVLPRVMADDPISKRDLARLGNGGLCLNCEVCHYPNCGFGKGGV